MARSSQITAQVVDTSTAYKESVTPQGLTLPRGTIQFKTLNGGPGNLVSVGYASPLDLSDLSVPLVGEHVVLIRGTSRDRGALTSTNNWYYSKIITIHDNVNANKLPGDSDYRVVDKRNDYLNGGVNNTSYIPSADSEYTHNESEVHSLQPYEGDKIIQSRYGSALRFSSTIIGNRSVYGSSPPWYGPRSGDPIITFTAGLTPGNKPSPFYISESPNDDPAFLYLCANQRIDFNTSQQISRAVNQSSDRYTGAQSIISSNRVIINSKDEQIYLSGGKNVTIATPNWQAPMDDIFTNIESLETQCANLSIQLTALAGQVNAMASAISVFSTVQASIAAAATVFAPLAPGLSALASTATPIAATTSTITGQLTTIQSELIKTKTKLSTLRQ